MGIIEMEVNVDCPGCEAKIRKALKKIDGVHDIEIDMDNQKVTVTGWADQDKVLKTVRKTGRTAELWSYTYNNPDYYNFNNNHHFSSNYNPHYYDYHGRYYSNYNPEYYHNYEQQPRPALLPVTYYHATPIESTPSYNYGMHGERYPYYEMARPRPGYATVHNDLGASVFSDENPNACSIM